MPCFLMDLRFATGREQKIRTFRFVSGAAMCGSAREETGSVASRMCASAIERS